MSGLGDESLGAAAPFPSGSGAVPYFGLSWKPAVETLRGLTKSVSKNQLPVRDASSLSLVKISKGNPKSLVQLILPLFNQVPWTNHETPLQVASGD